jgi:hypothetical protein
MIIDEVCRGAEDALRKAISWAPADYLDLETLAPLDAAHDALHECADGAVPIYNSDRADCLADDPALAYPEDDGLLPESPDVWTILGITIYERAYQAAAEHLQAITEYLPEFVDAALGGDAVLTSRAKCVVFVCENWRALDYASHAGYCPREAGWDFIGRDFYANDTINQRTVHGVRGFEYVTDRTVSVAGLLQAAVDG